MALSAHSCGSISQFPCNYFAFVFCDVGSPPEADCVPTCFEVVVLANAGFSYSLVPDGLGTGLGLRSYAIFMYTVRVHSRS